MEIDWTKYKQIILTDRPTPYKPDKQLLRRLRGMFPDINVWGFGHYYGGYWFILAFSQYFPENFSMPVGGTPILEVFKWAPAKVLKYTPSVTNPST